MKVFFGCAKGGLASNNNWTKLVHMPFSKNVKYHIVFLCFFFFPLRMVYFTELEWTGTVCFVKFVTTVNYSAVALLEGRWCFMMKERVIVSILFVVSASALNCSFSFLAFLLLFVCLQLTVDVVLFNEPLTTKFFQRHFPFYFLFSVKLVVGLACAILMNTCCPWAQAQCKVCIFLWIN